MESQPQNPKFRNSPENFHPCTCVAGDLVNISPFEKMAQNLSKTTSGPVPSRNQVDLAIDIPKNFILFTCGLGYLKCLFKYWSGYWDIL